MSSSATNTTLERTATAGQLALALDVDDLVAARRLAIDLAPYFGVAKVGMELFTAAGPEVIGILADLGYDVFLDLKLLDIPNTVERTARVLGALGANYLTLHAFGGVPMLAAGVKGLAEGATAAGLEIPVAVAVTVLTSDDGAPPHIMGKRAATAVEAGCGGIVCAADDLVEARQVAPRLTKIVPGIRLEGAPTHDQARPSTPKSAVEAGADLLVVGRAVTEADSPVEAAKAIADNLG
jgi:orotidine-5'-phosphate decarboxylase